MWHICPLAPLAMAECYPQKHELSSILSVQNGSKKNPYAEWHCPVMWPQSEVVQGLGSGHQQHLLQTEVASLSYLHSYYCDKIP